MHFGKGMAHQIRFPQHMCENSCKNFTQERNLEEYVAVNIGEKRLQCDHSGKKIAPKEILVKHMVLR